MNEKSIRLIVQEVMNMVYGTKMLQIGSPAPPINIRYRTAEENMRLKRETEYRKEHKNPYHGWRVRENDQRI